MRIILSAVAIVAMVTSPAFAKPKHHKAQTANEAQVAAVEQAPQPVDPNGYHAASGMEQVKAYCELVANGLQPGGSFVMGSPSFVAGAAIGSAIGGAITHAQNYDHCMVLKGYAHN